MKANRETIVLIAAAGALAMVISYTARPASAPVTTAPVDQHRVWAGNLAELVPGQDAMPSEPLSSAALTVPKSAMALPSLPHSQSKSRCEGSPCPAKVAGPATAARTKLASAGAGSIRAENRPVTRDDGLIHALNPMNHMPDIAMLRRPFESAGNTVVGWFRHF